MKEFLSQSKNKPFIVIPMLNPTDLAKLVIPFPALLYLLLTNREMKV